MRAWTIVIACALGCSEQTSGPTIEAMVVEVKPVVEPAKPAVIEEPRPTPPPPPAVKPAPVKPEPVKTAPPRHVPPSVKRPPHNPTPAGGSAGSGAPLPDLEQNPYLSK